MMSVIERFGDRVLRAVVPEAPAAACGTTKTLGDVLSYVTYYNLHNTCTGAKGCYADFHTYTTTNWNGYCLT